VGGHLELDISNKIWNRGSPGGEDVRKATKDLVDEIVVERTSGNPDFPDLVEAALRTRQLVRALTERRRAMGISQTLIAARMGTSQSALARLEAGGSDPRLSTLERYALALGDEVDVILSKRGSGLEDAHRRRS
jgi:predicted transcriptional regulator